MKKIYALIIAFTFISTSYLFAQAVIEIKVGQGGGLTYTPKNATCNVGDTIKFTWVSGNHPTVSDDNTTIPMFNMNSNNTSKKIVMTSAGTIPYYCTAHGGTGGAGMAGTITVSTSTGLTRSASLTSSLQVYPNPASEKVTVTLALGYRSEEDHFQHMKKVRKPNEKLFKFI